MFYKIFDDIRILEYSDSISASFCARILADLGAEVIKIETPDSTGQAEDKESYTHNSVLQRTGGLFQYLNMNKLGITLDLTRSKSKKVLVELLTGCDVFIDNLSSKYRGTLGLTYSFLQEIKPEIIMTSITPFGQSGPYCDYKGCELLNNHMSGVGYASTREVPPEQEPIKLPANVLGFQAGLSAAVATIGAIYRYKLSGKGTLIDISEQESAIQNLAIPMARYAYANQIVARTDILDRAPFHIIPCKDGYIYHAFVHEYQWERFVELMGRPDWAENELFKDYQTRGLYWDALKPLMMEWTMEHTMDEIYRLSQEKGAPIGAVYTAEEILQSPQLAARDFFVQVEPKENGSVQYPGIPYIFSGIQKKKPEAAPLLGQHNEYIYRNQLGYSGTALNELEKQGII